MSDEIQRLVCRNALTKHNYLTREPLCPPLSSSPPLSPSSRYFASFSPLTLFPCPSSHFSAGYIWICPHTTRYLVETHSYICVPILLYLCPHTAIPVSSYHYICVLILLYMCPHTTLYVSPYYYTCVLILLHMCPHTTIHVSPY